MKTIIKKSIIAILLAATLLLSMTSCTNYVATVEAEEHVVSFLYEVEQRDFDGAEEYIHPDHLSDLKVYFEDLEDEYSIDFSDGIGTILNEGVYYSYYTSQFSGPCVEIALKVQVGEKYAYCLFLVVENANGYGIADIYIDNYSSDAIDDAPTIEM